MKSWDDMKTLFSPLVVPVINDPEVKKARDERAQSQRHFEEGMSVMDNTVLKIVSQTSRKEDVS